jgi:nucleoside diphosphate kinase
MAMELAFALINPYSIAKSRTGGIIGRFMSRTGLEIVAARMFGPSAELVARYSEQIREDAEIEQPARHLLAEYVQRAYAPDPKTGRRRRVLMLLFEGDDAVERIRRVAGPIRPNADAGETVRDTFGDYIVGDDGQVRYIEPAVLVGVTPRRAASVLRLWTEYSERDGGVVAGAVDVNDHPDQQRTLVLIKPDNFKFPSSRPGNIIDLFSRSGLRIVGAKIHRMSVAEAEEFYGPVRTLLRTKLKEMVGERAARAVSKDLGIEIPTDLQTRLGEELGPHYGDQQFYQIIHFMTGYRANACTPEERVIPGKERCLALVYAGVDAVAKIRGILGPTDPSKAEPGQVRREFGQDVMINAAHASDSPENAAREMKIVKVEKDMIRFWVDKYYPA